MCIILCSSLSSFPSILFFPFCPSYVGVFPLCRYSRYPLFYSYFLMKHSILDKRRDTVENFKKLTKLRRLKKLMKFTRLKKLKSYKVHKVPPKKAVCGDDCKLDQELQKHRFCASPCKGHFSVM